MNKEVEVKRSRGKRRPFKIHMHMKRRGKRKMGGHEAPSEKFESLRGQKDTRIERI